MKTGVLLLAFFGVLIFNPLQAQQQETGSFGRPIDEKGAISVQKLSKKLQEADSSARLKVKGTILEVCQAKGCWMTMELDNGEIMRVKFKDYAFFVPKDAAGKSVVMEGTVSKELIDVYELKHLAKDAGKTKAEIDAIDQPGEELTFIADGVLIR
ncbi:MAG: DUF4920 domain-containing protein [Cyclobacteriaceae bacterium]|nr:DUF4920 domain-containing protein [Cyclobacteriaceae bacterium]